MGLEDVVKKLNKSVLMNDKIPEDLRMLQMQKLTPDKKRIFSEDRKRIIENLKNSRYKDNQELRKDLKAIDFDLSWAILRNLVLTNLDFSQVNFSVADLSGSDLSGCRLAGADFSISRLVDTNFSGAHMEGAVLTMVDCSSANFSTTNLPNANFVSCIAVGTNFSSANLSSADMSDSNLKNANFEGADTTAINLNNCILQGTIFEYLAEKSQEKKVNYTETMTGTYSEIEKVREYIAHEVYSSGTGEYKHSGEYDR